MIECSQVMNSSFIPIPKMSDCSENPSVRFDASISFDNDMPMPLNIIDGSVELISWANTNRKILGSFNKFIFLYNHWHKWLGLVWRLSRQHSIERWRCQACNSIWPHAGPIDKNILWNLDLDGSAFILVQIFFR